MVFGWNPKILHAVQARSKGRPCIGVVSIGQRKLGLFYQKDQQHGLRTIWYENGQQRLIAQFVDDKMEGNSKGWFPNGQQQFDYNFKNNQEHGVCTEWDPTGKKISELRFVDGAPVQDLLTGQRIRSEGEHGLETKQIVNEDKVKSATDLPEVPIKETEKPVNAPEAEIIEIPKVPQKTHPSCKSTGSDTRTTCSCRTCNCPNPTYQGGRSTFIHSSTPSAAACGSSD